MLSQDRITENKNVWSESISLGGHDQFGDVFATIDNNWRGVLLQADSSTAQDGCQIIDYTTGSKTWCFVACNEAPTKDQKENTLALLIAIEVSCVHELRQKLWTILQEDSRKHKNQLACYYAGLPSVLYRLILAETLVTRMSYKKEIQWNTSFHSSHPLNHFQTTPSRHKEPVLPLSTGELWTGCCLPLRLQAKCSRSVIQLNEF